MFSSDGALFASGAAAMALAEKRKKPSKAEENEEEEEGKREIEERTLEIDDNDGSWG